jgi:hypothetical protein
MLVRPETTALPRVWKLYHRAASLLKTMQRTYRLVKPVPAFQQDIGKVVKIPIGSVVEHVVMVDRIWIQNARWDGHFDHVRARPRGQQPQACTDCCYGVALSSSQCVRSLIPSITSEATRAQSQILDHSVLFGRRTSGCSVGK